jgi:hypothetical protein
MVDDRDVLLDITSISRQRDVLCGIVNFGGLCQCDGHCTFVSTRFTFSVGVRAQRSERGGV